MVRSFVSASEGIAQISAVLRLRSTACCHDSVQLLRSLRLMVTKTALRYRRGGRGDQQAMHAVVGSWCEMTVALFLVADFHYNAFTHQRRAINIPSLVELHTSR